MSAILPYVRLSRPDHWFKNVFVIPGIILSVFDNPTLLRWGLIPELFTAAISVCLIASSNYVINEILDAETDRLHPKKRLRPVPSGTVKLPIAYLEWILLGALGLLLAAAVNRHFLVFSVILLFMGMAYNIPPVRFKDAPYLDVLSESVNNPIRLLLGWYSVGNTNVIMLSIVMAYWMLGAFLMAVKRYAEYNYLGSKDRCAAYRKSFSYYDREKLLSSIIFFATSFGLFSGIFIVRYHIELIISVPFVSGFIAYYLHLGFQEDSPVQNPEKLYKNRAFVIYTTICFIVVSLLLFMDMPWVEALFST